MKNNIPNIITILNLTFGFIGISFLFSDNDTKVLYVVYICLILDYFDGFFARKLKLLSPFGKQIDSMADLVSFGVLPSIILYLWFENNSDYSMLKYSSVIILIVSSIRLAKFNISEPKFSSFIGLPTPANALFFTSLIYSPGFVEKFVDDKSVFFLIVIFSFLMISKIEFITMKFPNLSFKDNLEKYLLLILSIFVLIFLGHNSIFLVILIYIFLSVSKHLIKKL